MKIGQIKDILIARYHNESARKRACMLLGGAGVGKSQAVAQVAAELGIGFVDLRLAQCDFTELRGVPSVVNGRTVNNVPAFFPEEGTKGIFFLDEITSAVPAIQASAYQLVLDRKAGEYELPEGWMVVAAGNRQSDRGVTYVMAAPLTNRMCIVEAHSELDDWIEYASSQDLDPRVLAFVQARADFLHKYDEDSYGKQFPSPRSWFAVADQLQMGYDAEKRVEMIKGDVGEEAAVAFEGFLRNWETMPSIAKIFADPDSVALPHNRDEAICLALGISVRLDKDVFNNAWRYIKKLPGEFQPLIVKLAIQRDPDIQQATSYGEYILQNKHAFKR